MKYTFADIIKTYKQGNFPEVYRIISLSIDKSIILKELQKKINNSRYRVYKMCMNNFNKEVDVFLQTKDYKKLEKFLSKFGRSRNVTDDFNLNMLKSIQRNSIRIVLYNDNNLLWNIWEELGHPLNIDNFGEIRIEECKNAIKVFCAHKWPKETKTFCLLYENTGDKEDGKTSKNNQ